MHNWITLNPLHFVCKTYTYAECRGHAHLPQLTCPIKDLDTVLVVCLEFTNQKSGVQGKLIGLGRSGHPHFCPVQACIYCVKHLWSCRAPPTTPLYAFFSTCWQGITISIPTMELHNLVAVLGEAMGLTPSDILVRYLQSSDAMALLCSNVDSDLIRILRHWWSNKMLCYSHDQVQPVVAHLAPVMLQHGHFTLLPNWQLPQPHLLPVIGAI
jgi:hypothetical protein